MAHRAVVFAIARLSCFKNLKNVGFFRSHFPALIVSDGADVTCGGRLFQKLAPQTGKASLSTVERLDSFTASWLVKVDRSLPKWHVSDTGDALLDTKQWRLSVSLMCFRRLRFELST